MVTAGQLDDGTPRTASEALAFADTVSGYGPRYWVSVKSPVLHGPVAVARRVTVCRLTVRLVIESGFLFGLVNTRFSGTDTPGASGPARSPEMVNGLPDVVMTSCTLA